MLSFLIKTSRPRFWLYLGGTFLVGYGAGISTLNQFAHPWFFVYFIFFLFLANILLYGINDYYDADTDQYNEKKLTHEHLLLYSEQKKLKIILVLNSLLAFVLLMVEPSWLGKGLLAIFLLLAWCYSAPPIRCKARPIVDFASNILYGLPGFIGYALMTRQLPSGIIMLIVFCWTSAMHLFSAIPDIESDSKAGLKTTAVTLGEKKSLLLCTFFWALCATGIFWQKIFFPFSLAILIYPCIPLFLYFKPRYITRIYWFFPVINGMIGFLLFLLLILSKLE
jgi:4-hydroxybenzoate polyprenyltransferase